MPAQGSSQQEPDNSLAPLWITLGIALAGGIIWFYFYQQIIAVIFELRWWEAKLIGLIIPDSLAGPLKTAQDFIALSRQNQYSSTTFSDVMMVSDTIGWYLRFPVFAILAILGLILYLGDPTSRRKKVHSMQTLLENEKHIWPHIIPVSKLNLISEDIHKGPWAMAMTPMQYAKHYKLIFFEKKDLGAQRFIIKQVPTADILRDEARRNFALQLGRYWTTPEALPMHTRALFAIFAARANGDRESAIKLQEQISRSGEKSPNKLNFSDVDRLLKKHKDHKNIIKICNQHAFEYTTMASMLEFARQDGVLPSAEFLWLKPTDRRLWFLLNCVGRQTPFTEVAGIFSHWIAEKEFGKPLNVPMIEEAVNGLETAIKEIIYIPDEE